MIDAASWRAEQRIRLSTITAWQTANFSRAKKLPRLESILKPKRRRAESVEDQVAFFKAFAATVNARVAAEQRHA